MGVSPFETPPTSVTPIQPNKLVVKDEAIDYTPPQWNN